MKNFLLALLIVVGVVAVFTIADEYGAVAALLVVAIGVACAAITVSLRASHRP